MSKRETTMEALKYTIDLFKNRSQITFSCHDYFINMLEMAYDLLKEQEHKDRMFHALEDDWKRLKKLLKEQEETELCDRCGRRRLKSEREVK